jgi:hypothetical protein
LYTLGSSTEVADNQNGYQKIKRKMQIPVATSIFLKNGGANRRRSRRGTEKEVAQFCRERREERERYFMDNLLVRCMYV